MPIDDVLAFLERALAQAPTLEEEQAAVGSGTAVSRYVEGISNETELRGELEALGYRGLRVERYVLQAQLSRDLNAYRDRLAAWKRRREAGDITEGEFRTLLERAGAEPEEIERQVQLLTPKQVAAPIEASEIFLSVLSLEEAPERPVAVPAEISLSLRGATEVREVTEVMINTEISLALLVATEAPGPGVAVPTEISLRILELQEA